MCRCLDGDTITVRLDLSPQKLTRIRLIGVDTPEIAAGEFGETTGNYTRSLLQGQKVKLVYSGL
ncbi:MAG: thermonuclease family protein [Pelotomaculum sp.]|jgi:endonuclease YncB( thermonuclease family)